MTLGPTFVQSQVPGSTGTDLSGIGREGGAHSLHCYTEPTTVCVQL